MRGLRHPYSGMVYELTENGEVRVLAEDGREGVFSASGEHLRGEIWECDAVFAMWVAGPQLQHHKLGRSAG